MNGSDPSATDLSAQSPELPAQVEAFSPALYAELQRVARGQMRKEAAGHTLSATGVVNEAFLRMQKDGHAPALEHTQFVRLAARVMRNVLVDHARANLAQKRGGDVEFTSLDRTARAYHTRFSGQIFGEEAQALAEADEWGETDFVRLDEALATLRTLSPRQAEVVDLRFFSELSLEETAATLGLSLATVKRDWSVARLYLQRALSDDPENAGGGT
ncbi:MAG TPA: sigma-70 family RNA polymerase sigma factor [Casimicrobium sp.]|nr:sigma-70 family RNA polymerase sigma factor [Casimicrobium sp.]